MPTALYRFIVAALLLLPFAAQAGDADDFLAANPTQQAKLLQDWAAQPDPARIELVDALQRGQLTLNGETKTVRLNNRLRGLIDNVQASQQLLAADPKVRLAAAKTLQKSAQPAQLKFLDQQVAAETNEDVHSALSLALANLQLVDTDPAVRLAAVRLLGGTGDPLARTRLEALLAPGVETDAAVHTAAETSLAQVKRKLMFGEILGQAFSGMSLGSILLLAALGLAITFGLLGVINMAHGEMLMLGAYSTYVVQLMMQRYVPAAIEFYPLIALPVAFFVTAAIGMVLERTVIRHLYGRPLETLLATWGISLMLIQLVRLVFGAQNVEVSNPEWLSGGIQVLPNLVLPYNRIVIIAFALCVVVLTWLLLNKTRLGLNVRAVTQNRNMAACCGVPTGRVDMLAFGLGSGIAGLGGVALSQIGNVGPDLGQSYIIDSFLVVVLGGVGQLAGSVMAAFGLGIANKILEPQIGAVLGKILILALIILFIQKRPQGLFALKGRVID
ncbi:MULTISPECIES: urea ABC transporter permease subunit UrtB [Pseudomonas]|uniref:Urea transport system permease protein n=3 Tax=Bacteria TaxID=2 RepID=A0ABY1TBM6_PSEFL|nr:MULTISPECIES: urea ABC transporter permease subunit UrtB [Pseudomonas]MCI4604361.1 urea ABC transporter permease subunit UrtB [Pseudomonas fluorescens]NNB69649.1 urea ABC transporter permease subunit UrtB [Pseudomonas fluorescens]OEC74453.1 urea ABC transporter permease subunit UrtB [Pseudomonas sp. AP19]PQB01818.1 branched-chain amino acid ABC transporter permease [Pseudomonas fluorescens]RFP95778.1 urea ABC transporter permease subunit UrtB [Pseudomonas fluorescens]